MSAAAGVDPELAGYLGRQLAAVDPATTGAIESGPHDPALALPLSRIDRLVDPQALDLETGWCRLPDGTGYVAVRTEMPGVSPEMVDWWFDWHPRRPERYRVWHPQAHISNSLDPPEQAGEKPFWGAVHHAVEDIGEGPIHARIEFLPPVEFGFSAVAAAGPAVGTILCATVGDRWVRHSLMAHVFLKDGDGLVLRSHFWLAASISPRVPATLAPPARPVAALLNRRRVRARLLGDSTIHALARHCSEEYSNLAEILPGLFEHFGPSGRTRP